MEYNHHHDDDNHQARRKGEEQDEVVNRRRLVEEDQGDPGTELERRQAVLQQLTVLYGFSADMVQLAMSETGSTDLSICTAFILENSLGEDQGGPVQPVDHCPHVATHVRIRESQLPRRPQDAPCSYRPMTGAAAVSDTSIMPVQDSLSTIPGSSSTTSNRPGPDESTHTPCTPAAAMAAAKLPLSASWSSANTRRKSASDKENNDDDYDHHSSFPCRSQENWLCLTCGVVRCSRYVNGHALRHWEETKKALPPAMMDPHPESPLSAPTSTSGLPEGHCLACSLLDLSVWCHACQAYVRNDPVLGPWLRRLEHLKFGEEDTGTTVDNDGDQKLPAQPSSSSSSLANNPKFSFSLPHDKEPALKKAKASTTPVGVSMEAAVATASARQGHVEDNSSAPEDMDISGNRHGPPSTTPEDQVATEKPSAIIRHNRHQQSIVEEGESAKEDDDDDGEDDEEEEDQGHDDDNDDDDDDDDDDDEDNDDDEENRRNIIALITSTAAARGVPIELLLSQVASGHWDEDDDNNPPEDYPFGELPSSLEDVAHFIQSDQCRCILILAGAGMSVASGIPDFRSAGGLYATLDASLLTASEAERAQIRMDPTSALDKNMFLQNPLPCLELQREFILGTQEQRWKATLAHRFVELLHVKTQKLVRLYTQNIDGLEDQCTQLPTDKIISVHGSMDRAECARCGSSADFQSFCNQVRVQIKDLTGQDPDAPRISKAPTCSICGYAALKPSIVLFRESLPKIFFESLPNDVEQVDLLIIIGTSLSVAPANSLVWRVPKTCLRVLVNREPVGHHLGMSFHARGMHGNDDDDDHPEEEEDDDAKEGGVDTQGENRRPKLQGRDFFAQGDSDSVLLDLMVHLGWLSDLAPLLQGDFLPSSSANLLRDRLKHLRSTEKEPVSSAIH